MSDNKPTLRSWLGMAETFDWGKARLLGSFVSVISVLVVGGLFVLAVAAAFKLLGSAVFGELPEGTASSFGLTGIIVAMIGAPFVVWRAVVAQKQVDVAEQGQITDRISKAVEGLGAEKTVKRDGEESTTPNLEVRIGAIYALERIAQDSLRDHIQIMEILCAYIRENAPLRETPRNPFELWEEASKVEDDMPDLEMPDFLEMLRWANKLPKPRTDIQVALEVIGRRSPLQTNTERRATIRGSTVGYRLDFRETCLQNADLQELDFDYALLTKAQLQGASLHRTQLQGANLSSAQLQGADTRDALLQKTNLSDAQLQGADLDGAQLQGANIFGAQLQGAFVSMAQFQGGNLGWSQLQGARFSGAQLQGAVLAGAKFNPSTSLGGATLRGAALSEIDFTNTTVTQDQIEDMFGDATVILPGGHGPDHENWPAHWSKEKLKYPDFLTQWRAFQASIGQDPDNPA